ncbi:MAG: FAD binding domain-containing protein [Burkholderiaceae bacterium]|nr:FAD binding domain-containing protein [Burkholderiaceae bacterium]MDO9090142.1 FAD binding domain-containing protein [Burkholderiaceae bacterium]
MKPAEFHMERPGGLAEALALMAQHGADGRAIAGGQSLVPMMNLRIVSPMVLVDLNRVAELSGIRLEGATLRVGAMTRQHQLLSDPLVAQHAPLVARAMPYVGHVQTRNRGTIGGSLAHADPSAELPVTMVALGAVLHVHSANAHRRIAALDFFEDMLTTALQPGELLTEIEIPVAPAGTRACFTEFARRHGDFAIASCAAQFVPAGGQPRLEVALGGVGNVPHYCGALAESLALAGFARSAVDEAVEREIALLSPTQDLHADVALRTQLARVALTKCLKEILP